MTPARQFVVRTWALHRRAVLFVHPAVEDAYHMNRPCAVGSVGRWSSAFFIPFVIGRLAKTLRRWLVLRKTAPTLTTRFYAQATHPALVHHADGFAACAKRRRRVWFWCGDAEP